ncbi:MAG: FtsW/RodA/SpoVE family cell cycle protein, partial [Bacteroidaceae bacterium]|nr:FtsW/RodA/SpoVE family cell cycle protein [Bacteroidaceae bacterium]
SDFIFAIIIEELGLIGGFVIIMLYIILLFRASRIASRCERSFPAFLILGLTMLIVVQAAVNMSVAVGLVPVTGQPLPLISRGGSSIMVTSIYFGMMISISRFARKRQDVASTDPAPSEATAESAPAEPAPAADTSES